MASRLTRRPPWPSLQVPLTTGNLTINAVTASATPITADGVATSTITVTALDANSNPEIGDTITLGQGGGSSLITTVSGTTNSNGVRRPSRSRDTTAQAVTYTATDNTDGVIFNLTSTRSRLW